MKTEAILMLTSVGALLACLMFSPEIAAWRQKRRIAKQEKLIAQWRNRMRLFLNSEVDDGALMLAIIADKRKEEQELTLVEFECGTCTIRFWTEAGDRLPPSHCPHCGLRFTRMSKIEDVCYAN